MGQIQNAFNAGVGSIIASKGIAEHLQSQALDAVQSQYHEATDIGDKAEELANTIKKQSDKEQAAEDFKQESQEKLEIKHPRDEKSGRFVNKKEYQRKLDMDIDKAVNALTEVHKQQDATFAQKQAFKNKIEMYNKRGALVQNAINRLPAKKRPEQVDLDKIITKRQWNAIDAIKENR